MPFVLTSFRLANPILCCLENNGQEVFNSGLQVATAVLIAGVLVLWLWPCGCSDLCADLPCRLCMCPARFSGAVSCSQTCSSGFLWGISSTLSLLGSVCFRICFCTWRKKKNHNCILQSDSVQYLLISGKICLTFHLTKCLVLTASPSLFVIL